VGVWMRVWVGVRVRFPKCMWVCVCLWVGVLCVDAGTVVFTSTGYAIGAPLLNISLTLPVSVKCRYLSNQDQDHQSVTTRSWCTYLSIWMDRCQKLGPSDLDLNDGMNDAKARINPSWCTHSSCCDTAYYLKGG